MVFAIEVTASVTKVHRIVSCRYGGSCAFPALKVANTKRIAHLNQDDKTGRAASGNDKSLPPSPFVASIKRDLEVRV
jgi:hypothetical protein